MIDLTEHYTDPVFDWFKAGVQMLGGVRFDVRGTIALFGEEPEVRGVHSPEQVTGIKVGQRCGHIHFLHTARWTDSIQGAEIAAVAVKYGNGEVKKFPIQDLVQVANDWSSAPGKPKEADVVWIGTNPSANSSLECLRLFKYSWLNPHPDWDVSAVDLSSSRGNASYVLVAMTLE